MADADDYSNLVEFKPEIVKKWAKELLRQAEHLARAELRLGIVSTHVAGSQQEQPVDDWLKELALLSVLRWVSDEKLAGPREASSGSGTQPAGVQGNAQDFARWSLSWEALGLRAAWLWLRQIQVDSALDELRRWMADPHKQVWRQRIEDWLQRASGTKTLHVGRVPGLLADTRLNQGYVADVCVLIHEGCSTVKSGIRLRVAVGDRTRSFRLAPKTWGSIRLGVLHGLLAAQAWTMPGDKRQCWSRLVRDAELQCEPHSSNAWLADSSPLLREDGWVQRLADQGSLVDVTIGLDVPSITGDSLGLAVTAATASAVLGTPLGKHEIWDTALTGAVDHTERVGPVGSIERAKLTAGEHHKLICYTVVPSQAQNLLEVHTWVRKLLGKQRLTPLDFGVVFQVLEELRELDPLLELASRAGALLDAFGPHPEQNSKEAQPRFPGSGIRLRPWRQLCDLARDRVQRHRDQHYPPDGVWPLEPTLLANPSALVPEAGQPNPPDAASAGAGAPDRLHHALSELFRKPGRPHLILTGEPNSGKSTAALELLRQCCSPEPEESARSYRPLGLFLDLPEVWHPRDAGLEDAILRELFGVSRDADVTVDRRTALQKLLEFPFDDKGRRLPVLLLVVDGYHQLDLERRHTLWHQIRTLLDGPERWDGLQVLWICREPPRAETLAGLFATVALEPLSRQQIESYLGVQGLPVPDTPELMRLMGRPLHLALYGRAAPQITRSGSSPYCFFTPSRPAADSKSVLPWAFLRRKRTPASLGELEWNYFETERARLTALSHSEWSAEPLPLLVLGHLLPAIAWEMACSAASLSDQQCVALWLERLGRLDDAGFHRAFPELTWASASKTSAVARLVSELRSSDLRSRLFLFLAEQMHLLRQTPGPNSGLAWEFLNEAHCAFFAARHVLNRLHEDVVCAPGDRGLFPELLMPLPAGVARVLHELLGEHQSSLWREGVARPDESEPPEAELERVLEKLRSSSPAARPGGGARELCGTRDYRVWNVLELCKRGGRDLTRLSLRDLDLTQVRLNGVRVGRFFHDRSASFTASCLSPSTLLPQGHTGKIQAIAFSPDGALLATGGEDGTIRLWDPETGDELKSLDAREPVWSLDVGSDVLAAGLENGCLLFWSWRGGRSPVFRRGHSGAVRALDLSLDGRLLVSGGAGEVVLWWAPDWEKQPLCQWPGAHIGALSLHPDGQRLAVAVRASVQLWHVDAGSCLGNPRHKANVTAACWPAARILATACQDGTLWLWMGKEGAWQQQPLGCHGPGGPVSLAASPDGKSVASAGQDGIVRIWRLAGVLPPDVLRPDREASPIRCLSFRPADRRPAGQSGVRPHRPLLATAGDDSSACLWDLGMGGRQTLRGQRRRVHAVRFSPGSRVLATGCDDGAIRLWSAGLVRRKEPPAAGDALRFRVERVLTGHGAALVALGFARGGQLLVSGSEDGEIRFWDLGQFERLSCTNEERLPRRHLTCLAVSSDGLLVAIGDADGSVWLGRQNGSVWTFDEIGCHGGAVTGLSFRPGGTDLASLGKDGILMLWRVDEQRALGKPLPHESPVHCVDWAGDGTIAVGTSRGTVFLWSRPAGEWQSQVLDPYRPNDKHRPEVHSLCLGSGGRVLASADRRTVRLWEQRNGWTPREVGRHGGDVTSVSLSADGGLLASAGKDAGTVRVWRLDPDLETSDMDGLLAELPEVPGLLVQGADFAGARGLDDVLPLLEQYGARVHRSEP